MTREEAAAMLAELRDQFRRLSPWVYDSAFVVMPILDYYAAEVERVEASERGARELYRNAEARAAAAEAERDKYKELANWQNWPNRRGPTRGGYEFYINEEWTGIREANLDDSVDCAATLMKTRYDPDDERVRIRRVNDDDALIADADRAAAAEAKVAELESVLRKVRTYTAHMEGTSPNGFRYRTAIDLMDAALSRPATTGGGGADDKAAPAVEGK